MKKKRKKEGKSFHFLQPLYSLHRFNEDSTTYYTSFVGLGKFLVKLMTTSRDPFRAHRDNLLERLYLS